MNAITEQKARLLDLTTGVLELVRDRKRDIEQVSEIFQIIKDEPDFYGSLFKNKKDKSEFLEFISGKESPILGPTDGTEILADAKEIFAYINPDFISYDTDEKGLPTGETPVAVYEMIKDATFSEMFGSLSSDLNDLCLTQAQIKSFVRNYRNWLTDSYANLFLLKLHNQFFVACVDLFSSGGLRVGVRRFESSFNWTVNHRLRLVVPQLA